MLRRVSGPVVAWLLVAFAAAEAEERGVRIHRVEAGETLSEIAQDAVGSAERGSRFLQVLNGLEDPSALRIGQTLRIPDSPKSLLEPLGIAVHDCVDFGSSGFDLRDTADSDRMLVGVTCFDEVGYATRHFVLELGAETRTLVFDSRDSAGVDPESQEQIDGLQEWWFVDLDGDGGADLVGEMSQGSVNNTTQWLFHHTQDGYRPCLLFRETSLGDVLERRDAEGAMVFEVSARETDVSQTLAWSELRRGRCR